MKREVKEFIEELKRISNLAALECATMTENYSLKYADFIEYKYSNIDKMIAGNDVVKSVENQLEVYHIRNSGKVDYDVRCSTDLGEIMLPAISILALIDAVVAFYIGNNRNIKVVFNVESNSEIFIEFLMVGKIDWSQIISSNDVDERFSFETGKKKWLEKFGENSVMCEDSKITLNF